MKQKLFVLGVAMAALASCSQNEVLDIPESRTIQFADSYVGKPTRGSIITNDNFKSFYVFGNKYEGSTWDTKIFDNVNVYKGDGTAWGYDDLVTYEGSKKYSFAAYSNGGIYGKGDGIINGVKFTVSDTPDETKLEFTDYSTADNRDLVVSFSRTDLESNNQAVKFDFKHALAQVKVIIQSALGDENRIAISNFSVQGFKDQANLTFTKKDHVQADEISWGNSLSSNKTINQLDNSEATTSNSAYGTYTVIPQKAVGNGSGQDNQLNIQFDATLYKNNGTKVEKKPMKANISNLPLFEAGKCYILRATIDGPDMDVISFDTPEVKDWVDAGDTPFDPQKS